MDLTKGEPYAETSADVWQHPRGVLEDEREGLGEPREGSGRHPRMSRDTPGRWRETFADVSGHLLGVVEDLRGRLRCTTLQRQSNPTDIPVTRGVSENRPDSDFFLRRGLKFSDRPADRYGRSERSSEARRVDAPEPPALPRIVAQEALMSNAPHVFTIAAYLARPQLDVPTTIAFSYALATAFQRSFGPRAQEALYIVQTSCASLEAAWRAQQAQPSEDHRPARFALVNAWAAAVTRVEQYTRLPPERHAAQPVAARLYALIASDGLNVNKAVGRTLWSTLKTRLDLVKEQGLFDDLRRIAGPEFVEEVIHCHSALGRALSITESTEVPTADNLLELLRQHAQAVSDYVVQVAATVRRDEPATVKAALDALRPIDDMRELTVRRESPAQTAQPTQPVSAPVPQPTQPAQPPEQPVAQPTPTPVTKPLVAPRPSAPPGPN